MWELYWHYHRPSVVRLKFDTDVLDFLQNPTSLTVRHPEAYPKDLGPLNIRKNILKVMLKDDKDS